MNGILEKYILHKNGEFLVEIPAGNMTEFVVRNLKPFSTYQFRSDGLKNLNVKSKVVFDKNYRFLIRYLIISD